MKNKRKSRSGIVISNAMEKTLVVRVQRIERHPLYRKGVKVSKKYYAHVTDSKAYPLGTRVELEETRPLSKLKRWRVLEKS